MARSGRSVALPPLSNTGRDLAVGGRLERDPRAGEPVHLDSTSHHLLLHWLFGFIHSPLTWGWPDREYNEGNGRIQFPTHVGMTGDGLPFGYPEFQRWEGAPTSASSLISCGASRLQAGEDVKLFLPC